MGQSFDRTEASMLLEICSDAEILTLLSQPTALRQLDTICRLHGATPGSGAKYYAMLNGYKLVAGTALYNLLNFIVLFPDILGIEQKDANLFRWWEYAKVHGGPALHAAFTEGESKQVRIASHVDGIIGAVRTATTVDDLSIALKEANQLGEILAKSARKCAPSTFDRNPNYCSSEEALQWRSVEKLFDYVDDARELKIAYGFIWYGSEHHDEDRYRSFWDMQTHIDHFPSFGSGQGLVSRWKSGIAAAVLIALEQLRVIETEEDIHTLFRSVMKSSVRLVDILAQTMDGEFPSLRFGLNPPLRLSARDWSWLQAKVHPVTALQQIEALLGNDPRVVAADDPMDPWHLDMVLTGAISVLGNAGRVQVIRIQHVDTPDWLTWFSIAVHTPSPNGIVNLSKWWVFYKIYDKGSPGRELPTAKRHVEATLENFKNRIDLREFTDISVGDFLNICEPAAWRHLVGRGRKVEVENANLRGILPELLAAIQLGHERYQKIRVGAKLPKLGNKELDVVGVRQDTDGDRIVIVEIKGRADSVNELEHEIEKFSAKLDYLRERKLQLAAALGYNLNTLEISGRFVAMAEIDSAKWSTVGLEVWDFRRFTRELTKARVPRRIVDLLQPRVLAVELSTILEERMNSARTEGIVPERIGLGWLLGIEDTESL